MKLLEQIDGKRVQVTCLKEEQLDLRALEEISQLEMDELMSISVDDNVVYSCLNFISLSKRLEKPINRFDFHMIVAQIAQMHKIAKHLEWNSADILWNPDYVYMSPTTREVKFIYLPKNDIQLNSITYMLEKIIYSAQQSDPDDTYLSEFVYYLKRLGMFTSEDILEYIMQEDSKVTRLLQLRNPIPYASPQKEDPIESREFDVPNFVPVKVIKIDEQEETKEEKVEEVVHESMHTVDYSIGDETLKEIIFESGVLMENSKNPHLEDLHLEDNEDLELDTSEIVEEVSQSNPRLSFLDLFSEKPSEMEDFMEEKEEATSEFEPLQVEEVSEKVESDFVFESAVDVEDSTQEIEFQEEDKEELEMVENESNLVQAVLTRVSNEERAVIDLEEYVLGKSSFVNGMVIKGNPGISRKHAMIRLEDGQYFIRDLDSVNGTYVNDVYVEPDTEVQILNGDSIKLGDEELIFTYK